jgi:hypothetical protein
MGLQRSVSLGPHTLFERPLAVLLSVGLAFMGSGAIRSITRGSDPVWLVAAVLVGDVIGAAILAPIAVGELELVHAPTVFVVLTVLGLQPLAAFSGAWLAQRWRISP